MTGQIGDHVGRFVLSVVPFKQGFGYAIMENADTLVDWAIKEAKQEKNEGALKRFRELLHIFQPGILVVEDTDDQGSRRRCRIRRLIDAMIGICEERELQVSRIAKSAVRAYFSGDGKISKHEIAKQIAAAFPMLSHRLRQKARSWETEKHSLAIFEAVALALTYFDGQARHTEAQQGTLL